MFKAGDIIKGLNTSVIGNLLKGRVLELIDSDMIVEVLEHKDSNQLGICFIVVNSEEYFELYDNKSNDSEIKYDDIIKLLNIKDSNDEIRSLESSLSDLLVRKDELKSRLANYVRDIDNTKNKIDRIKSSNFKSDLAIKVLDELNLIKDDPKCKKVILSNNSVYIYTNQLYIADENNPNGHFKMNEYKIVINLNNFSIRIYGELENYNRTSSWGSQCPHPNISKSGYPFWGNTESMLVDAMSSKDLYTIFMIIINFLESFDMDDDNGKNLKNWDFVSKDDNVSILDNPYKLNQSATDCG